MNWGIFWHLNEVCGTIFEKVIKHKIRTLFLRQKSKKNGLAANLSALFCHTAILNSLLLYAAKLNPPYLKMSHTVHACVGLHVCA